MELAWQQMNANWQHDFRIVSENLYAIMNTFALNRLWLFLNRPAVLCCVALMLPLILFRVSFVVDLVTALTSLPTLLRMVIVFFF